MRYIILVLLIGTAHAQFTGGTKKEIDIIIPFENLVIQSTSHLELPSGTTAQRDGTPTNGAIRYNSDDNQFEGYANGVWGAIGGGGGGTYAQEVPTGTINGTNQSFSLSQTPTSNESVVIYRNGLVLRQGTDYSIMDAGFSMSVAPELGDELYATYVID